MGIRKRINTGTLKSSCMKSKQTHSRSPWAIKVLLSIGVLLLILPNADSTWDLSLRRVSISFAMAGCALLAQHQLRRVLAPPRRLRWILLPALIGASPFLLISLPAPASILLPTFALAWLLSCTSFVPLPLLSRVVILTLFAWQRLSLLPSLPAFDFPHIPSVTRVWIVIAIVLPLGIATQSRLRGFAKGMALIELSFLFLAASLIPVTLQVASGFKEVGEPERDFFSLTPLPGFKTVPNVGSENLLPSELRNLPDPLLGLKLLNNMNAGLQAHELNSVAGELDPKKALLLLQQTGFLRRDRYGFFVSPQTFDDPQLPNTIDQSFIDVVNRLATHATYEAAPEERSTLLRLRSKNLVDTVPGNSSGFRLTSQARYPFENTLRPRQLLFASSVANVPDAIRIHHADYAPQWNLSFEQIRQELLQLEEAGVLEIDQSRSWYPYSPKDLRIGSLLRGLLISLLGFLAIHTAVPLPTSQKIKLAAFGLAMVSAHVAATLPGVNAPLVHQAVWATLWLPVSALLLGIALK